MDEADRGFVDADNKDALDVVDVANDDRGHPSSAFPSNPDRPWSQHS